MNKIFIALCAFAALASALGVEISDDFSQLSMATTDSAETSRLTGENEVLAPFCIQTRDFVFNDIERNSNEAASRAFTLLFGLAETLGNAALNSVSYGNAKLTPQIANPNLPIEQIENPTELEASVLAGQQNVANARIQPKSFVEAFKTVVSSTSSAVANAFNEKISQIKDTATSFGSISTLESICNKVQLYENALQSRFEEYKAKVAAENPDLLKADMTLSKAPCTTSTRVVRINTVCQFAKMSSPALQKLWATRGGNQVEAAN